MNSQPFFSVIVPLYNQAHYVGEALDTLLAQTFTNWECIIVNDGSTDHSESVSLRYVKKDSRFRYFKKENGGCGSALNEGLLHVRGEWICWLSSDDFFEPDKLENHVKAININPEIKFFYSLWYAYLEDSKQKLPQNLKYQAPNHDYQVLEFFRINYVHGNSFAMHHSVINTVGNFNVDLKQGQDFDMWLRISARYRTKFMPVRTCTTRLHEAQTTNLFPEGGTFDSTRSLFEFTNRSSFQDIFPFSNVDDPESFEKFFRDIIMVNSDPDFFVNKLGINTILIDKALDFATRTFTREQRKSMQISITPFLDAIRYQLRNSPILRVIERADITKDVVYMPHDILAIAKEQARKIAATGYQKKCMVYEKFVFNYTKGLDPDIIYFEKAKKETAETLSPQNILKWTVKSVSQKKNLYAHTFILKCQHCKSTFDYYTEFEYKAEEQSELFLCPSCKRTYTFAEGVCPSYVKYCVEKQHRITHAPLQTAQPFAFIIPVADYLGGGTKVVFQYIEWLVSLGIPCTIYTKSKRPDWVQFDAPFIQYENLDGIDFSRYNHIVTFSVFEILELLPHVPIHKIIHLCQGYQGYHYGTTFEIMRSDKYIFDALHAIPVKLFVVSKHLAQLFKERFNRESYYIPNYIDHSVFYPKADIVKLPDSILFIGTPDHVLKNFIFLVMAVKHIMQTSPDRKPVIHLVTGHVRQNDEVTGHDLTAETGVQIKCYHHVHPQEIAYLINAVSVVVCTSWYEGFGLPVLEAMACGTPVVTTNTMGTEVFCHNNINARVIDVFNGIEFAEALLSAFEEKSSVMKMLPAAIEMAASYNYNKSAEAFTKAIFEITGLKKSIPFSSIAISPVHEKSFLPVDIMIPAREDTIPDKLYLQAFEESTRAALQISIIINANIEHAEMLHAIHIKNLLHITEERDANEYSALLNRGLRAVRYTYVLLTLPGIIPCKKTIDLMYEALQNLPPEFGILFSSNGNYLSAQSQSIQEINFKQVATHPLTCMLIRKSVVDAIGGFDPRFHCMQALVDDYLLRAQFGGFKILSADNVYSQETYQLEQHYSNEDIAAFSEKWKGTPEEIFTGVKTAANRHHLLPLHPYRLKEMLYRGQVMIQDNDIEWAYLFYAGVLETLKTEPSNMALSEIDKISLLTAKLASLREKK